jgi:16S rRNA (adenine1518-N6/adenine1519-N6)-dimethyltransferase
LKDVSKAQNDIDMLPPLREVISKYRLNADKALGQNFLLDMNITDKIVRYADNIESSVVYEVGPGPGGLTRSLLKAGAKKVIALEYDKRAVAALEDLVQAYPGKLEVLNEDALKADLTALDKDRSHKIIANLPYNISTQLLLKWLQDVRNDSCCYDEMILMFQKEVAQRICATAGTKSYGRLSIISQWLCKAEILFHLPPSAFVPTPKVTSSVVRFKPLEISSHSPTFSDVSELTAKAFGQRRKMIRSSLKKYESTLKACDIDMTLRAEDLPPELYIKIANNIVE